MFCRYCGAKLEDNAQFCNNCGKATQESAPLTPRQPAAASVPEENRPLSPWAYFGLQLLFAVPVVGLIFLIIFSIKRSNINRRNFARSYWCSLLILAILFVVVLLISLATGEGMYYYYGS